MQRESMSFDVIIVGAGPAGLSAAIRLAQLTRNTPSPLSIGVIEKGATIGAHSISGAVLEPRALDELLPTWRANPGFLHTQTTRDEFLLLSKRRAWRLPTPTTMKNKKNYIISLGNFCQWLAQQAEQLGVNVFAGFAADKILYDGAKVIGIQTGAMGLTADGQQGERYQAGIHLLAQQTLFAEGCRGSLTQQLITKFQLRTGHNPQTYAIGIKELWKINPAQHELGKVVHTLGWPLDHATYGGAFIYHCYDQLISLGMVVGLDYTNPFLDPFQELQRVKTHPRLRPLLQGGTCIGYGARALNEGGLQAIPKLTFPGGMLIGCAAGFLNVVKIKGIHTAMKSGMLAAEAIATTAKNQLATELSAYIKAVRHSWIYQELRQVRNVRPAFRKGLWPGLIYSAFDQYVLRGRAPWTLRYNQPDHLMLKPAKQCVRIQYPKPDGKLTFDKLTQIHLSTLKQREDQPCHLLLKHARAPIDINLTHYDTPEQRYCPANVYEIITHKDKPQLRINATNCIHCKTCDIKDPTQNIIWITPEGGNGPNYSNL